MLDVMRRHSESFLIYLIFGAIIVVFALSFGPGSGSCGQSGGANYAVMVDGDAVPAHQFAATYSRLVDYHRRRAQAVQQEFSNEMIQAMGLKQQVVDELIDQKLLAHEAERWGLRVSAEELREHLKTRYPTAMGQIKSRREYDNWVSRQFRTSVQGFESDRRDEILGQRIARLLASNVSVSEGELRADYVQEHDRAMATYVKLDPNEVKTPEPSKSQIDKLLSEDFEAVQTSYDNEALKYRTPHRVRARQIMVALSQDASEADVAKARGKLLELKTQIEGGADFAALAKEYSQDQATAQKGGDVGLFARGEQSEAIDKVAFKLNKDEIAGEPVRSDRGMHLIQVTEIQPPARRKLEEVKGEVAKAVLRERHQDQTAKVRAADLLAKLEGGRSLASLTISAEEAQERPGTTSLVRRETSWILRTQQAIPRIGTSKELHDSLFALTKEKPVADQVFEVNGSYFVIVLEDRELPDLEKFESEKDSLRRISISVKQSRVMRSWMRHLRRNARIEYNPQIFPPRTAAEG